MKNLRCKNKKYCPSNGTEGMEFMERFCLKCEKDAKYQETMSGEDGCQILAKTMLYDINNPEYPKEWIYKNGKPICTAFEKIKGG